jgi:hypothetical protein
VGVAGVGEHVAGRDAGGGHRGQYRVLSGAQDSDGGGLERYWGIRWGMTGEAAGGVFVGGGTWPMGVGWVRRLEVTML